MLAAAPAHAALGDLTQKSGLPGCISETGNGGVCVDGFGLRALADAAVSPDGRNVYVAARGSGAPGSVAILDRDPATGALTQKAGSAGCISSHASLAATCTVARALASPASVAVSPDGRSVYAANQSQGSVVVLDRDPATGALTQKAGTAGCISDNGSGGLCVDGRALDTAFDVVISTDGRSVYVAAIGSGAVAVFDRDTGTGALTQKAGTAGCVSDDGSGGACVDGRALGSAGSLAISPDGRSVYAGAFQAAANFDRDPATGALTQKAGTAGCVSQNGTGGMCGNVGDELDGFAVDVEVSPDGASVYAAGDGGAVAVFDRLATGALSQKTGSAGCLTSNAALVASEGCALGRAFTAPSDLTVSPDGASLYVSAFDSAVAIIDRGATGALSQKAGAAGCVSEDGSGGACADGRALGSAQGVTVSPDGRSVYGMGSDDFGTGGVAVLDRDALPETAIVSGPAEGSSIADARATFAFSSTDAGSTFECRVDGAPFAACAAPFTTTALGAGQHTFAVRAIDPSGNVDPTPATRTFTVQPPAGGGDPPPDPVPPGALPAPPTAVVTNVRPQIRGASLSSSVFRVNPSGQVAQRRAPRGTAFRVTLSEAARVTFTIERRSTGRRAGGRCVRTTRANRRRSRCTRHTRVGSFARALPAGAARVAFSGRLRVRGRARALAPARYRVTLLARDAGGLTSLPRRLAFRVVRR